MSSSIFSKIVQLSQGDKQRTEDVFTEIFNNFLLYQKDISWLLKICNFNNPIETKVASSATQVYLGALDFHATASIVDVMIETSDSIIFIESKIDSQEGPNQLQRYFDHLDNDKHRKNKILLYITKNYDYKQIEDYKMEGITFGQTTWSKVYFALKSKKFTPKPGVKYYLNEMLTFMEEMDMAQPELKIEDLLALKHYRNTTRFLEKFQLVGDECLAGKSLDNKGLVNNINIKGRTKTYNPGWDYLYERWVEVFPEKSNYTLVGYCLDISEDVRPMVYVETRISDIENLLINSPYSDWHYIDWKDSRGFEKTLSLGGYFNSNDQFEEIKTFFNSALESAFKIAKIIKDNFEKKALSVPESNDMTKDI